MAASTVQGEQLKDYLKCSICLNVFTDPRTLPCLHTFCFECISQWCNQRSGENVPCPDCRSEFGIPENGIADLKKNFFVGNLLCMKEVKHKTTDTVETCEICSDEEKQVAVEMFCLQCEQKYCKSCSNAHLRMKIGISHTMVSYTTSLTRQEVVLHDINKKSRSTFCDEHNDKQIELYCFEDKVAICMMCYVNDHSSHTCKEIKKTVNEFRIVLEQDMECVTTAQQKNVEIQRKLNSRKQSLFSHRQNIETKIGKKADEMIHLIQIHKQNLISQVKLITDKRETEIDRLTEELDTTKALLTSFVSYGDELLNEGSDVDISRQAACLRQRAQELLNTNTSEDVLKRVDAADVIFKPSSMILYNTTAIIGNLEIATTALNTVVTTKAIEPVHASNQGASKETPIVAHTLMDCKVRVNALALMNDDLFVSHNGVTHVSVYDLQRLKLKREISIPQLGLYSLGLAACPFNKFLFVSDWKNDCVHKVDLLTDEITQWKTARNPRGLSCTSEFTILVTSSSLQRVQEYTPTGTLLREVSDSNRLWQAVETKNDTLLVSRCGPLHGIAELTWTGQVLRCCNNETGSVLCEIMFPRSLAVTWNGIVLVADGGHNRILVLQSSLTTSHSLPLPGDTTLNRPVALCYDESRGRLFVAECDGAWRVLELDHVGFYLSSTSGPKPVCFSTQRASVQLEFA